VKRPSFPNLLLTFFPNLLDEADNKFIEAATAIIVTYNVRDFAQVDLVKHGWDVMTPFEFTTLYDLEN